MLPIGDILPGTTAMVIERWWRSALAARADEDDANDKQKQADRIRRRMQRMIQLNNAIPFRQKIQAEQEPNTQQYLQGSTQSNSDAYDDYEDEEEEE